MIYFRVAGWAMMRFGSFVSWLLNTFFCQCLHTRSSMRVHSTSRQKNMGDTNLSFFFFNVMSRTVFYNVPVVHRVFRFFVDSFPARKASDASALSIPDFTPRQMCCRFGVFGDSLESTALNLQADFRLFSRCHDPTTHVCRARFLTNVG